MRESHDCANLPPLGARASSSDQQTQRERGLAALNKLKAWGLKQKEATSARTTAALATKTQKAAAANFKALNTLKREAKGDTKVPLEKRVYLHVEASADTTTAKYPTGKFFYSAEWSVGRVLDAAAKALQVQNVNNRGGGEGDRLRVFHVEQGRLLEFSERVGEVLKSGNTVVLLRGVGPPAPDLIEP